MVMMNREVDNQLVLHRSHGKEEESEASVFQMEYGGCWKPFHLNDLLILGFTGKSATENEGDCINSCHEDQNSKCWHVFLV